MHTMLQLILTEGLGKLTFIADKLRLKNMLQCNGWHGAGHLSDRISAQTLLIFMVGRLLWMYVPLQNIHSSSVSTLEIVSFSSVPIK